MCCATRVGIILTRRLTWTGSRRASDGCPAPVPRRGWCPRRLRRRRQTPDRNVSARLRGEARARHFLEALGAGKELLRLAAGDARRPLIVRRREAFEADDPHRPAAWQL